MSYVKGLKIPFLKFPKQRFPPREPKWSLNEMDDLDSSIKKFIKLGALSKVKACKNQFLSNIFLRKKSDNTNRLIINLKALNKYVQCNHFKIEDHKTVKRLIRENCYIATMDLKDAYTFIPIKSSHKKYLRFSFRGQIYQFNCLPFGLNCAPLIFTKLMKPVVSFLRGKGLVSVIYLDDLLLMGESYSECYENILKTKWILKSLWFLINNNKSCLVPSQRSTYLGFCYDSVKMISLPPEKRNNIFKLAKKFSKHKKCKIRDFARFLGSLASVCPATRYGWLYTKLFERQKYLALQNSSNNYDAIMYISPTLSGDFRWWLNNIHYSENSIKPLKFELKIFSDASLTGWGIVCKGIKSHGLWDESEREHHINYLELLAAFFGLKCFADHLSNCNILCRVDNTTALSYINRMGSVQFPKLNFLTREIWQWCEKRNLIIFASYINTKENTEADQESRKLNLETEWELNDRAFRKIISEFESPVVDLFASRNNNKCTRFVSWLRDPEAWAVDAFTLNWSRFFFYAFPPFALILRVLQKIIDDKAEGILIVPNWTSQPWYPTFCSLLSKPPLLFTPDINLLYSFDRSPHPLWEKLTLVAGTLSCKHCN